MFPRNYARSARRIAITIVNLFYFPVLVDLVKYSWTCRFRERFTGTRSSVESRIYGELHLRHLNNFAGLLGLSILDFFKF